VRLDATDEVVGCHETRSDAVAQIAALHATEHLRGTSVTMRSLDDLDLKPTDGMVQEAERGLEWRSEYGRGGTPVGIARARDIANRTRLSPDTVMRMNSFFSRHEVDKQGTGWSPGEDGYPSNGRIAWALWGGDPGQTWAAARSDQIKAVREENQ
jgi:hypothetical protein